MSPSPTANKRTPQLWQSVAYGWASPRRVEVKTTTMHGEPISYEGDSVIFDPRRMVIGFPHVFRFLDHYMAVIKSQDGTLNFFYFDNPEDEAVE